MLLFATAQAEVELDAAVSIMQIQGNQGIAALFGFPYEFLDFFGMKQKLAGAGGFGADVRRCGG